MSKKSIRIISTILTIIIALMILTTVSFAENYTPGSFTGNTQNVEGLNTITGVGNKIVGVIRVIGMISSVVIIMVLGIKYMVGSAEEKASYKKTMMPFIVGAVLLFAASALADLIFKFARSLQ